MWSALNRSLPLAALAVLSLPVMASAETVTLYAAASLKDALDEASREWQAASDHELVISYAGSNALARQITEGAPADLFISASSEWMDHLDQEGATHQGSRRDLLLNRLVIVAHGEGADQDLTPRDALAQLQADDKLAMALVDAVPAGQYGKAALEGLGLWDSLSPQVAQADNVRAALALVALGEAPLGIVYKTDAQAEPKVHISATFPDSLIAPARYPIALLGEDPSSAARTLYDHLTSPEATAIFQKHGFMTPE